MHAVYVKPRFQSSSVVVRRPPAPWTGGGARPQPSVGAGAQTHPGDRRVPLGSRFPAVATRRRPERQRASFAGRPAPACPAACRVPRLSPTAGPDSGGAIPPTATRICLRRDQPQKPAAGTGPGAGRRAAPGGGLRPKHCSSTPAGDARLRPRPLGDYRQTTTRAFLAEKAVLGPRLRPPCPAVRAAQMVNVGHLGAASRHP